MQHEQDGDSAKLDKLYALNQELQEASRQLREANAHLEQQERLKTEFFSNMSHELRTPLNAIIGFAQVMLKGIDGPLTELQHTDLMAIYSSGQHLLALVNGILDLSKIEAGKMDLFKEWLPVQEIAAGVMTSTIVLIGGKDIELVEDIPADLPLLYADRVRIRQVILNLVSNAAKFTDQGSITLRVRADGQDWLIVSVEDTGIGIADEDMSGLFDHYVQISRSSVRRAEGTGLGLSISKKLVELHGGQMWVKSQVNKGSIFYFSLPLRASGPPHGEGGA